MRAKSNAMVKETPPVRSKYPLFFEAEATYEEASEKRDKAALLMVTIFEKEEFRSSSHPRKRTNRSQRGATLELKMRSCANHSLTPKIS